jgi:hypothetical protein
MGLDMSDFKLGFLGQRRRGAAAVNRPLDELAEHIHALDAAAQQASRRINQSARKLRSGHKWRPESHQDLLAELADLLEGRADAIRADCERLAGLLDRARAVIGAEDGDEPAEAGVDEDVDDDGGEPVWEPPAVVPGEDAAIGEGVRLIATQMAIAGATRGEIGARLREQFGIEEAQPVLDEIFGQPAVEARS